MIYLEKLGFNEQRLRMAGCNAVACILAVLAAWALGLEHPQWAGMSVWATALPLRGQIFEKSALRTLGTLAGVIAGIGLALVSQLSPYLLVVGLAAWIALCTWASNVSRGLSSYGMALAGYSAAMVVLLDTGTPDDVMALGLDRFLTVLTGVVIAALTAAIFAQKTEREKVTKALQALVARARHMQDDPDASPEQIEEMLREIARFEDELEPHAAGSVRARAFVKAARRELLEQTLQLVHKPLSPRDRQWLANTDFALPPQPRLAPLDPPDPEPPEETAQINLHRDLRGARESALRAGGVLLLVGMLWQLTGLAAGAYFLLGLSVMLSLFSSMDLPTSILRHVILGQVLAGIAAIACQMLLWPYASSVLVQILMLIPFIILGVLVSAHRKTFIAAMDYHLVFLLLMMPHMPFETRFGPLLTTVVAVIAAPILALLCYKTIFPVHLRRRITHIERMFDLDLVAIAGKSDAPARMMQWNSRFAHRSLRLLRLHDKLELPRGNGLAQIRLYSRLARAAFAAQDLLGQSDVSASQRRVARQVLARIAQNPTPETASFALGRLSPFAQGRLRDLLAAGLR